MNYETIFIKSDIPKAGDIVLWDGHTGIIENFDAENGKVIVLHSTRYARKNTDGTTSLIKSSTCREIYSLQYYKNKNAFFYRPVNETPDVLDRVYEVTLPEIVIKPFNDCKNVN